jgi:hypothetical protein
VIVAAGAEAALAVKAATTTADEIGCERRQPINLVLRIAILDRNVLALDIAGFLQALEKRNGDVLVDLINGLGDKEPDRRWPTESPGW